MKPISAEKARWAPLLLLVAVLGGGGAQTVEVCDLENIVQQADTTFWHPNFEGSVGSDTTATVTLEEKDAAGTEVIVLKAIPLTHCEDKVRYYAREITPTGTALATYEVNSITGVVTVKTGANLRSFTGQAPVCFYVYTYYDVGVQQCPSDAACVLAVNCTDVFCCRDASLDPSNSACHQSCVQSESDTVFHPVRATDNTVCNVQLRDRDRVTVCVTVADSNDPPNVVCPSTGVNISETATVGTRVTAPINATDPDPGLNGTIRFNLVQRLPDASFGKYFEIDSVSGVILTAGVLDFDRRSAYQLTVVVHDLGRPQLSDSCDMEITVMRATETPPRFAHDVYSTCIDEIPSTAPASFADVQRQVIRLEAYNVNTGSTEGIQYELSTSNMSGQSLTGFDPSASVRFWLADRFIFTSGPFDREEVSTYTFQVKAWHTDPTQTAEATVVVCVSDVNEPPRWPRSLYVTSVSERPQVDTEIHHLIAVDDDSGSLNKELSYSMVSDILSVTTHGDEETHDRNTIFRVDSGGAIVVNQDISYQNYRYFQFDVRVTDRDGQSDGLTANAEVFVVVVDVNDHEPTFTSANYSQALCENTASGTYHVPIQATDPDHGSAGSLTFSLTGDLSTRFGFNPDPPFLTYPHLSTDHVEVIADTVLNNLQSFDYEEVQSYELTIIARDNTVSEPLRAEAHAFAYVCDRNDNPPMFDQLAYVTEVQENERTIIATIRISDNDLSIENQLSTLEITGGDDSNRFYLEAADEPNVWFLHVVDLDFDNTQPNPRVIHIMATNEGMTLTGVCHNVCPLDTLSAMTTVTVTVHDANDNCPIFSPAHYDNINVNESQDAGHFVAQLMATDADERSTPQSTLRYYLKSNTGRGLFNVDENTGEVTILNPPDFEEIHQITLSAYVIDLGEKGDSYPCSLAEATVEIDIVNLNDNPPYWIGCPYFVNCISESVEQNHFVVKVITMDEDWDGLIPQDRAGSQVQYSIAGQTRTGTFVIHSYTGVITVNDPTLLDREMYAAEHFITVEATDGNHVISCNVTVLVCDANDNCPHFTKGGMQNNATVSEGCGDGSAGSLVTLQFPLVWVDDDVTDENRDTAYAIVDSEPPNAPFRIERYSGQLYVTSLGVDFENVQQWTLTLAVFDEANRQCPDGSTSYCTVVIDVTDRNDNLIGFETTLYPIEEVAEGPNSNGVTIEELHNVDPTLAVTIASVEHCPNTWFEVAQIPLATGSWFLRVANQVFDSSDVLDREEASLVRHSTSGHALCIINLRASADAGSCMTFTDEAKALVEITDINDNDPIISTGNIVRTVPENAEVGYTVAHVAATDADWGTNSDLHYYLDPLQTDFTINPDSGALASANVLDHERQVTYSFGACVADRGTPNVRSACIDVTLTVSDQQDHCPFLTVNPLSVTRNEGDNPGDIGVTISAVDRDSSGNISSLRLLPESSPFELNVTGLGTSSVTATIQQKVSPDGETDHERQSVYHLTIVAEDNTIAAAGTCLDATVVKVVIEDLPDESPSLTATQFTATLCEDAVGGEVVELHPPLDAVDLDIVLDTNQQDPDDTLTYTIAPVDPAPPGLFIMNPVTRELQLAAGMQLDRETTTAYAYTVTVSDSSGNSDTGRIDITVCDVNDNPPTWDCDALEAAIEAALATQFTDPTCGGITYYRYAGFSCNFRVHVPEIAGVNCLLIGNVALLSYVSDRDEPNSDNSNIWLKVDHGDDEAIGLGLNPGSTTTPVDPEDVPTTESSNGKLYIHERLDYFKKPFHTLTLRALDHGNPPMTGNVFFNVTLEPCNRPPTCSSQNFTYCEETETRVGLVTAMDENDGTLGALSYNITSVSPPEVVIGTHVELRHINNNVEVWLMGVDYETVQHVVVVVEASDGGNGSECDLNAATGASGGLSCTTTIEAVVLDINDNTPIISDPSTQALVLPQCFDENTIPMVYTFAAYDIDSGKNGEIYFQITQQEPNNIFRIHPDTGELWFENALDYEEWCGTNFSATVRACDMGLLGENRFVCLNESWFLERCSDTVTVQACLQGVNDNPPVCPHILKQCIPEQNYSSPSQLQVVRINCTDADSSCPNSPATPFTYTIDSVVVYEVFDGQQLNPATVNGLFEVDSNGFLRVIGNIDREGREDVHNDEYLVHMTVTDGAPTPHSTTVGVVVCVEEVNDEPPVCPTNLRMDFACALANASAAVIISEDSDTAHQVINIAALDPDLDPQLVYQIVAVTPAHLDRWTIDGTGAVRYTFEHIDYEELWNDHGTDTYYMHLRVVDENTARNDRFCELSICIQITDVNDNPPVWTQPSYNISTCISESAPNDTFVFSMAGLVSDNDITPPNNVWEYMLEDPSAPERALPFYIKPGTTDIHLTTSASLDYETQTEYQIYMIAVDRPGYEERRLSSHATLYIQICDDILEDPVIEDISVQAPENHSDPIFLFNLRTVTTTDGDINYESIYNSTNPIFHYFLVTPPSNNLIEVDMTTGIVTLDPMNSLDYEVPGLRTQYATVAVRSSMYTTAPVTFEDFQNSGFAQVMVESYDINDNPPNLNKSPLYLRPGKNYILIPVDHLLEYGEPIGQMFATDIDSANNHAVVRYERYDPAPGEPFYFHVTELGEIQTAATFRDRIESTYNFTVEAYDNLREDPTFSDLVMIRMIITADERRVILTIDREIQEVTRDIETIVNIVNGVTGRIMIVDRIRYASSDDLSTVEVSETDVIFHCIEVDRDEITDARTIVHILDTNFIFINSKFTSQYFIAARVFPSGINQYELQIPGLIIAIIIVVILILLICFCCCVLCCWEWRRRRSYKKKLSYMSFDEGKFITVDSGKHVEYDIQEIAVEMNREEEDEEDWLKMDHPPEWLRRVEVEEYDDWMPPPVRPPPPEPVFVPETTVEEETHEEVVVERVEKKQEITVVEKVETKVEVEPEPAPVPVMVRIAKPKVKEYDEQEQTLQMFHDYDSEGGVDSDAELRLDRVPSGMMSGDEDVEIEEYEADDFGQEAFQLTSFADDFDDVDEDETKRLL